MKTYAGSIQRKGARLYLVTRVCGRQKWFSLRTGDLSLARRRAAKIAPPDAECDTDWLEQLVRLGDRAAETLRTRRAAADLTWDNLSARFFSAAVPAAPEASAPSYRRWLAILESAAAAVCGRKSSPGRISPPAADRIAARLLSTHLSADRMLVFYRRVWRTLGLDPRVWAARRAKPRAPCPKEREHYRRLSVAEVARVVRFLSARDSAGADMVAVGYFTGLRLSDVAELERSELDAGCGFLRICPNKTRNVKARTLVVPLVGTARERVARRLAAMRSDERYVFPEAARARPSRRISAAFRACGVCKEGAGRASFHSLRATFISLMDEAGVPPHVTDAITGHGGGGMHARYTQPSAASLAAAVLRAIPPLEDA